MVAVDPATLPDRLRAAGLVDALSATRPHPP